MSNREDWMSNEKLSELRRDIAVPDAFSPFDRKAVVQVIDELRERHASDLALDDYEAVNLLWLIRLASRLHLDTGDWCGQICHKLEARGHASVAEPNSSPSDTDMRLQMAARELLPSEDISPADVEALRWLRSRSWTQVTKSPLYEDNAVATGAIAVLDKLIAGASKP